MSNASNKNPNNDSQKKDLLSIKPEFSLSKKKNVVKTMIIIVFALLTLLVGWVIFDNYKSSNKKVSVAVNNSSDGRMSPGQFDEAYTKEVDNLVKKKDYIHAYKMCSIISSQYYAVSKYKEAKDRVVECSDKIKEKLPIPWFIYKDQAYLDLKLNNKESAKSNLNQAISIYTDLDFESKNSLEAMKQQINKL